MPRLLAVGRLKQTARHRAALVRSAGALACAVQVRRVERPRQTAQAGARASSRIPPPAQIHSASELVYE